VRDTGTGIPAAVLERITEPFFTTKEVGKGTGLGLSMVLGFVEQSGGQFEIDSVVGEGTSVRLLMPAVRQPQVTERPVEVSRSARPVKLRRVLVVDDDQTVGTIIAEQLRELGATVQCVPSAAEAFNLLCSADEPFDLLLTDYAMPGINGLEVIAHARALRPGLPCVLMTGYADDSAGASLPEAPYLLRKPVSVEDLEALLSGEVAA
jgi:CheY-like chemotaxis protein